MSIGYHSVHQFSVRDKLAHYSVPKRVGHSLKVELKVEQEVNKH